MSIGKGLISAFGVGRKKANQEGTNGSVIRLLKLYEVSVNPASLAANTGDETDVTISGVTTDDVIVAIEAHSAALNDGICVSARVKAADTVAFHFVNVTAGAIDVAATTFKVLVARIADSDQ